MALDPIVRGLLDYMATLNAPAFETLTPQEARKVLFSQPGEPEPCARVENRTVPGPKGDVPVRVYTPAGEAPFPVLVYAHGGGWVIGDLESHDSICRSLTNAAACVTVAVDYGLAPEHKFPEPVEEAYAATAYVASHASEFGADASRLAIGGDSAGGNIAAAVALIARERGGPSIVSQSLIYPVTNLDFTTDSYRDNASGYFLTASTMRWFWGHYLRDASDGAHEYASPLRAADCSALPPTLVITAEYDPLRDEGEAYAARLRDAGVETVLHRYDGMTHGFVGLAALVPQGRVAIDEVAAFLRRTFAVQPATANG